MARDTLSIASEARAFLIGGMEAAVKRHLGESVSAAAVKSDLQASIITAFSAVFSGNTNALYGIDEGDEMDGPVVF